MLIGPLLLITLIYFGFVLLSPPCSEVWDRFCGVEHPTSPIATWRTASKANHLVYAGALVLLLGYGWFETFRAAWRGRPLSALRRISAIGAFAIWLGLLVF
ncbi:hypothetical protein [Sphingomonas sp. KR3-1]|uniref:hypothetical protein n=1 Tax=Sphingomonas sp. KR3-1 TaxID=3156611 RepID=UPI0032B36B48